MSLVHAIEMLKFDDKKGLIRVISNSNTFTEKISTNIKKFQRYLISERDNSF